MLPKLEIYRAIESQWISQKFGENRCFLPYCDVHRKFYPQEIYCPECGAELKKISLYKHLGMLGHNGFDFPLKNGAPICWDCNVRGTVIGLSEEKNEGIGITVITKTQEGYMKHRFWHLKEIKIGQGDIVETGDLIGWGNNTGRSTGPHLHRDIKPQGVRADGRYYNLYKNNGYKGAIDLAPFYKHIFVKDLMKNLHQQVMIYQRIISLFKDFIRDFKGLK